MMSKIASPAVTVGLLLALAGAAIAAPLVEVSGTSPFSHCTADNVSSQPGVTFPNSEVEPYVVANPTNPANLVGSWIQDRWSRLGGGRGLVAAVSVDAGTSWDPVVIPGLTACAGGQFDRATDPWLSFAPNGHLYHLSLSFDPLVPSGFSGGSTLAGLLVSKSTNGGLTWEPPVTIAEDTQPRRGSDKPSITADPTDPNLVYAVWNRVDLAQAGIVNPDRATGLGTKAVSIFARTTNGGASWEPARVVYDPGANNLTIAHQIVVLPDGTLLNLFNELIGFRNDDGGTHFDSNLALFRSADKGQTWSPAGRPLRFAKTLTIGVVDPESGSPIRTGDVIPDFGVDRNTGALYAVWQDARFGNFEYDSIAFSTSSDGGVTWSKPIRINQTPSNAPVANRQAFTASVRVADNGTIGVTYYDFRFNTQTNTLLTDYWIVQCDPGSTDCTDPARWAHETRVTSKSFDMRQAPLVNGGYFVGDYAGLTAAGKDFVVFFSQPQRVDSSSVFSKRIANIKR